MAIYGYTKNYKLIKPQFNTDTWHDYIYDNLDTIDAVMSAIYASGNWKGFWAKNMTYVAGDVIIDQDTDTMYKVMIDHVTSMDTFAAEQTAHPDYYELWSPNNLAESWATKTDGKVSNTDYSAKAYAISSGLIDDGSAKEWAIGSGAIGNTNEYSAKKYATDAHNDYISMTTNPNVAAVASNINNVNAVGQSISNVNTVAGDISSVNTVAGVSTDVTAVANVASSVPTVANNDTNVTTVATNISDVKTAATNIEAIQDAYNNANTAQTMATQAAQSASEAAQSATASATSANNSHIWAEGTDAQVQALGGVHSSKVWAEQSTNANIALTNSPYTTNRILEIPQDIKLELNDGTLTLKAGSKVYVPNGFEADGTTPKFDAVVLEQDCSGTITDGNYKDLFFYYNPNTSVINFISETASTIASGTSYAGNNSFYYHIGDNNCRRTKGNGTIVNGQSLFLGKCSSDTTGITSIDQVFNGFGYIGLTLFVLPGVKVQIPNGRNEDGTYRIIPYSTQNVIAREVTGTGVKDITIQPNGVLNWATGGVYLAEDGYLRNHTNGSINISLVLARVLITTAGKIDSFVPSNVDSVVNSNASNFSQAGRSYLSGLGMPSGKYIDLTLGASGSTYTAPANGWVILSGNITDQQSVSLARTSIGEWLDITDRKTGITNKSARNVACIPVRKGDSFTALYNSADTLRFIYSEGEE